MSKVDITEEELNKLKLVSQFMFKDELSDKASYDEYKKALKPLITDSDLSLEKAYKDICGDKKTDMTLIHLIKAFLKTKPKSKEKLGKNGEKLISSIMNDIMKKDLDFLEGGKKGEKDKIYTTAKFNKKSFISDFNVLCDKKGDIKGFKIKYEDSGIINAYDTGDKNLKEKMKIELGEVDEEEVEKMKDKITNENEYIFRDSILALYGTATDKINSIGAKLRSGKTYDYGDPEGEPFLIGANGSQFHGGSFTVGENGIKKVVPLLKETPRKNLNLDKVTLDSITPDLLAEEGETKKQNEDEEENSEEKEEKKDKKEKETKKEKKEEKEEEEEEKEEVEEKSLRGASKKAVKPNKKEEEEEEETKPIKSSSKQTKKVTPKDDEEEENEEEEPPKKETKKSTSTKDDGKNKRSGRRVVNVEPEEEEEEPEKKENVRVRVKKNKKEEPEEEEENEEEEPPKKETKKTTSKKEEETKKKTNKRVVNVEPEEEEEEPEKKENVRVRVKKGKKEEPEEEEENEEEEPPKKVKKSSKQEDEEEPSAKKSSMSKGLFTKTKSKIKNAIEDELKQTMDKVFEEEGEPLDDMDKVKSYYLDYEDGYILGIENNSKHNLDMNLQIEGLEIIEPKEFRKIDDPDFLLKAKSKMSFITKIIPDFEDDVTFSFGPQEDK